MMPGSSAAVGVRAVGLLAPGLPGWLPSRDVLCGTAPYLPNGLPDPAPDLLPPNERRRTTFTIRLALQVANEALAAAGAPSHAVRSVFACSGGDTETLDRICSTLAQPERQVSPAQFHNSVHNAPAGYWSIATRSHAASSSLGAYDASFAAGLLEAVTVVLADGEPVVLVAYDTPAPPALLPFRPLSAPFGAALVLSPAGRHEALASLGVRIANGACETSMGDCGLERLRLGNPAARSLPLLQRLANGGSGEVVLPYLGDSRVVVGIAPC